MDCKQNLRISLDRQASALFNEGRYREVVPVLREAISVGMQITRKGDRKVAEHYVMLLQALKQIEKTAELRSAAKQVLALARSTGSPAYEDVRGIALEFLADAYSQEKGNSQLREAAEHYKEALARWERIVRSNTQAPARALRICEKLAIVHRRLDDENDAERFENEAASYRKELILH